MIHEVLNNGFNRPPSRPFPSSFASSSWDSSSSWKLEAEPERDRTSFLMFLVDIVAAMSSDVLWDVIPWFRQAKANFQHPKGPRNCFEYSRNQIGTWPRQWGVSCKSLLATILFSWESADVGARVSHLFGQWYANHVIGLSTQMGLLLFLVGVVAPRFWIWLNCSQDHGGTLAVHMWL